MAAEICRNRFLQKNESFAPKNPYSSHPTPGSALFCVFPERNVPNMVRVQAGGVERVFAAIDTTLYELYSGGNKDNRGTFDHGAGTSALTIVASDSQLLICANGFLYTYDLGTNTLTDVASPPDTGFSFVLTTDGYGIAFKANSNKFYFSSNNDFSTWDAADVIAVSEFPGDIVGAIIDHRQIIIHGAENSIIYVNTGSAQVFEPIDGAYVADGSAAGRSDVRADNSDFWIAGDERGGYRIVRLNGATGARVSTHAIEYKLRQYAIAGGATGISDAIGFAYEMDGHTFACWYFPSANMPHLVYDCATGFWHEWSYRDPASGQDLPHRSMCHVFAFKKHLVGDWNSGNVYELKPATWNGNAWTFATDAGNPIVRVQQSGYIGNEMSLMQHDELRLDVNSGAGPIPSLTNADGSVRGPIVTMTFSDDNGNTFSNENPCEIGQAGEYSARVNWRRLGMSRGRRYRFTDSDAVPIVYAAGYLNSEGA